MDDVSREPILTQVALAARGLLGVELDERPAFRGAERQERETDHPAPRAEIAERIHGSTGGGEVDEVNRIGVEAVAALGLVKSELEVRGRSKQGRAIYSSHASAERSLMPPSEYQRSLKSSD